MASTVVEPVADAIKARLEAMGATIKPYRWSPVDLDEVPAAVVMLPEIERVEPEQPESQLGSSDWRMLYPVVLYFDLAEAFSSQAMAAEYVERFARSIDAGADLDGTAIDSKMVTATPQYPSAEDARPLLTYECEVRVLTLVPYQ